MITDINELIIKYKGERRLGIIIFGEADSGKSRYFQKLISRNSKIKGLYLNIEEEFVQTKKSEDIFSLNPELFIKWISQIIKIKLDYYDYFIIDEMDFLFNLWENNKKMEFIKRVQEIEKTIFINPIIFVLQEDELILSAFTKENELLKEDKTKVLHLLNYKYLKQI